MFHQDGNYFGNIRAGIRISANRPIFAFPAVKATECDQGVRDDLWELKKMVLDSKVSGNHERELFDKLCERYVECNGNYKYNGESLRDGSFLITHCPVVWTATDRYDFIRKLGEYRDQNKCFYDQLTSDTSKKAIPIDFWTRIETAEQSTLAFKLQPLYYYDNRNTMSYSSTESIRQLHRCGYEHKLKKRSKKNVQNFEEDSDDDVVQEIPSTATSNTLPSSKSAVGNKGRDVAQPSNFKKLSVVSSNSVASMLMKTPEQVVEDRHRKGASQITLENRLRNSEEKERAHMQIANFFYECGIPFNAANSRSYEVMVESIGQYGPGLKLPIYHELRVPLLKNAKDETEKLKEKHEKAWNKYGCTLMSDGWTDKRGRSLINFLANKALSFWVRLMLQENHMMHKCHKCWQTCLKAR
ncbi:hypothetical protein AgCh_004289 [Apium graveolens]